MIFFTPRSAIPGVLAAVALLSSALPGLAAGFTAEQAEAGKTAYNANCAQCHGMQLEGPEAPGLVGPDIMANWDTPGGLYDFISVAMPPSAPGQLGAATYLDIIAYIMAFNGAQPGPDPLVEDEEKLAAISLTAETAAGPAGGAAPASDSMAADTNVPQAFTWGKPLPGGPAVDTMQTSAAAASSIPQAFTWGKPLPTVE
ncbi:cytochrome C [Haematobacter massiliensis]|uniref:Cytochrome C n=2 Tax=Haematobacter massiliensis TaxID=195105 RepID=A0A086YAN4_9RHOB|nr:cytochrome c [Haematobacter massiliensis]KFI31334.1 cytochrome C [Haematobacter massiliensis]